MKKRGLAVDASRRSAHKSARSGTITTVVVIVAGALLATAVFYMQVRLHANVIRANKGEYYEKMEARLALDMCRSYELMEEAGAAEFCAEARSVVNTPLEDIVKEEAWDAAVGRIYDACTSLTGGVLATVVAVVVVMTIVRCVKVVVWPASSAMLP